MNQNVSVGKQTPCHEICPPMTSGLLGGGVQLRVSGIRSKFTACYGVPIFYCDVLKKKSSTILYCMFVSSKAVKLSQ